MPPHAWSRPNRGRPPRDQRRRHAPGAGTRLCDARRPRAAGHSLDPGRVLDRRQPRHPRPTRHDRRPARRQYALVTAAIASVRNHTAAMGRSHLEAEALVVSPYAAGLACLVEDERDLGSPSSTWAAARRRSAVFFGGNLIFADAVPVGGTHVTNDIARGLSTPLAHAERMKTLFGSAISSTLDEREMIAVTPIGEEEDGHVNHVPKSLLVSISRRARRNLRAGAQPARRQRLRPDSRPPRGTDRRRLPAAWRA